MIGVPSSFLIGCLRHISLWSLQARGCSTQCLIHIFGHIRHTWKLTFGIRVTKNVKGVSYWFLIGRLMWCCRRIYLWSSQTCHQLSKKFQKRFSGETYCLKRKCDKWGVLWRWRGNKTLPAVGVFCVLVTHNVSSDIAHFISTNKTHTCAYMPKCTLGKQKHTIWHAALIDIQHILSQAIEAQREKTYLSTSMTQPCLLSTGCLQQ